MIRSVRAGGRTYNVTTWKCKYDTGREGCACCIPKDALHPSAIRRPGIREFVFPIEARKSRAYVFRQRSSADGSAKSKFKR